MSATIDTRVATGRISPKISPWTAVTAGCVGDIRDEHPRPHDVAEREPRLGQGALDDREDRAGLRGHVTRVLRPAARPGVGGPGHPA